MAHRSIRDTVHNFVNVEGKAAALLDTRPMQRLRRIKQLALASLVYPGALHTRFEHSLGVYHVASMLWDLLRGETEKAYGEVLQWACLLHDVGHGPFSHVSEGLLEAFADEAALAGRRSTGLKVHELLTCDIIGSDPEIGKILSDTDRQQVVGLLRREFPAPWLRDILSGPLDADKQDYLLRDSRSCGVEYGVFDIHQLHRSLCRAPDGDGGQLMVRRDGIHAVEQFMLAKYYLTAQVYGHRVRRITDEMLVRAVCLGIEEDEIAVLRDVYAYDGTPAALERFLSWDDTQFMSVLGDERLRGTACHALIERLQWRRLFKQVFVTSLSLPGSTELSGERAGPVPALGEAARDALVPLRRATSRKLEQELAEVISSTAGVSVRPELVILRPYSLSSVREEARNQQTSLLVEPHQPGRPGLFEELSTLFRSIDEQLGETYLGVYAPVDWPSPERRLDIRRRLYEPVMQVLANARSEESDAEGDAAHGDATDIHPPRA